MCYIYHAGHRVWKKRDALDGFLNPFNEDPFTTVTMTTEVTITSQDRRPSQTNIGVREIDKCHVDESYDAYSVNIEIGRFHRPEQSRKPSSPAVFRIPTVTRAAALTEENADAFLYARVAFLFFIALLITWVPSSVNRASALAHPERLNFALNFTSAFVFSIQGFLNCLVYMTTSQSACRRLWAKMWKRDCDPSANKKGFTPFSTGRASERDGGERLDSDATSTTNLNAG